MPAGKLEPAHPYFGKVMTTFYEEKIKKEQASIEIMNSLYKALRINLSIPDIPATRRHTMDGEHFDLLRKKGVYDDSISKIGKIYQTIKFSSTPMSVSQIFEKTKIKEAIIQNSIRRLFINKKLERIKRTVDGSRIYFYWIKNDK